MAWLPFLRYDIHIHTVKGATHLLLEDKGAKTAGIQAGLAIHASVHLHPIIRALIYVYLISLRGFAQASSATPGCQRGLSGIWRA